MPQTKFDEKIGSSVINEAGFKGLFRESMRTDDFRNKIINIFLEHMNTVTFANKVKKYAAEEMDKRIFRSFQYWTTVVVSSAVAGILAVLISKIFSKQ